MSAGNPKPRLTLLTCVLRKECRHLLTADQRLFDQPFTQECAEQLATNPDLADRAEDLQTRLGTADSRWRRRRPRCIRGLHDNPFQRTHRLAPIVQQLMKRNPEYRTSQEAVQADDPPAFGNRHHRWESPRNAPKHALQISPVRDLRRFRLLRADLRIHLVALSQALSRPCGLCANTGPRHLHGRYGARLVGHRAPQPAVAKPAARLCGGRGHHRTLWAGVSPGLRVDHQCRSSPT